MSKINKSLDYNKLLEQQAKGKLLKKVLQFPLIVSTKYDGNYVSIHIENGLIKFITSGGLSYTHTESTGIFAKAKDGVYLAERIHGYGKLGDRVRCNLRGPKDNQTSTGHTYMVFDYLSHDEYNQGYSNYNYETRYLSLKMSGVSLYNVVETRTIENKYELDMMLAIVVKQGYEGLMLMAPKWKWKNTKSRTIDFCKYKKRRTADLFCIGVEEGEGKYEGMIGSLVLKDSEGRVVSVGSGLMDSDRLLPDSDFLLEVIEIEFETTTDDSYIQPTYKGIRYDKQKTDID